MPYPTRFIWNVEKFFRRSEYSKNNPNYKVEWISHHIPKTAGSSLNRSYISTFGENRVFGIYAETGAADMTAGKPIWVPYKSLVLHGHFRPHPNHIMTFPNSKKIVWVRDPIERLWSHVGHLMDIGSPHPQYELLKSRYIENGVTEREEMVRDLIVNHSEPSLSNIYSRFFAKVLITDFDFVGSVHDYEGSMQRLAKLTGVSLPHQYTNVRSSAGVTIPSAITDLKEHMSEEYDIVQEFL